MTEHQEQAVLVIWCAVKARSVPELALIYAIPNGAKLPWRKNAKGQRYSPEALRLKEEGLKPGVPDMCLPVARNGYHGLYLENKFGRNKPSPEQEWWLDRLAEQGYLAIVCWSFEEAREAICEYLGLVQS